MPSSPSENEFAEYCSQSGVAIASLVIGRTEQLTFVKFRTADWEGYNGFSNYATTALFPEHLRPADPRSPGVVGFVQALASEVAAQQQHLTNCRPQGTDLGRRGASLGRIIVTQNNRSLTIQRARFATMYYPCTHASPGGLWFWVEVNFRNRHFVKLFWPFAERYSRLGKRRK
jgi:hypothetical protein